MEGWKSLRGARVTWRQDDVKAAAQALHDATPQSCKALLGSPNWKGGALLAIKDVDWNVKECDLKANFTLLKAAVEMFPSCIPSAFFWADVFLELNGMLHGRLFPAQSRATADLALEEAGKMKKLMSKLRTLWRDSAGAKSGVVLALKSKLQPAKSNRVESPGHVTGSPVLMDVDTPATTAGTSVEDRLIELFVMKFGNCDTWTPELLTDIGKLVSEVQEDAMSDPESMLQVVQSTLGIGTCPTSSSGLPTPDKAHGVDASACSAPSSGSDKHQVAYGNVADDALFDATLQACGLAAPDEPTTRRESSTYKSVLQAPDLPEPACAARVEVDNRGVDIRDRRYAATARINTPILSTSRQRWLNIRQLALIVHSRMHSPSRNRSGKQPARRATRSRRRLSRGASPQPQKYCAAV